MRRVIALVAIAAAIAIAVLTWPGMTDTDCAAPQDPTQLVTATQCRLGEDK
jgi:hypothetical protein